MTAALPTRVPAAERLVAIGDLHGDLGKAKRAFRAAGLTNERDQWVGGTTVAVQVCANRLKRAVHAVCACHGNTHACLLTAQVGDVLDRGDQELRILLFLESLQAQARAAGGALHVLNGKCVCACG